MMELNSNQWNVVVYMDSDWRNVVVYMDSDWRNVVVYYCAAATWQTVIRTRNSTGLDSKISNLTTTMQPQIQQSNY